MAGAAGTGNPPYQAMQEREQMSGAPGQSQTFNYISICKMPQYSSKSSHVMPLSRRSCTSTGGMQ